MTTVDVIAPTPVAARDLLDDVQSSLDDDAVVEARAVHRIPPASRVRWSRTASLRGALIGGGIGAWGAGLLTLILAFTVGLAPWAALFSVAAGFGFGALAGALAGLAGRDHRLQSLARRLGGDRVAVMLRIDDRSVRPERVSAIAARHGEVVAA